jgi:hypothetical protein
MTRATLHKSMRLFRKLSEESLRRRGQLPLGKEGVGALSTLENVLAGKEPMRGELLQPLAAFTNLLAGGELPPEFGRANFADALLALDEARQDLEARAEQRWEFAPELTPQAARELVELAGASAREQNFDDSSDQAPGSLRLIREACAQAPPGAAVVCASTAGPLLGLSDLCRRFERVILVGVDAQGLKALVLQVPEPLRARLQLELYDLTGSLLAFRSVVDEIGRSTSVDSRPRALAQMLDGYDVAASSAGISALEPRAALAVSTELLPELALPHRACLLRALGEGARGWGAELESSFELFRCRIQQLHIQALLRRAELCVLTSALREAEARAGAGGALAPAGQIKELLSVEHLSERIPRGFEIVSQAAWELVHEGRGGALPRVQAVEGLIARRKRDASGAA